MTHLCNNVTWECIPVEDAGKLLCADLAEQLADALNATECTHDVSEGIVTAAAIILALGLGVVAAYLAWQLHKATRIDRELVLSDPEDFEL
jgi:hypothetical protein